MAIKKESILEGVYTLAILLYLIGLGYLGWTYIPEFVTWVFDSLNIKGGEIVKRIFLGLIGACGTTLGAFVAVKIRSSIEARGLILRLLSLSHAIEDITRCLQRSEAISVGGVGTVLFHEKEVSKITKYVESKDAYTILKVISAMKYISDPAAQISPAEFTDIVSRIEKPNIGDVIKQLSTLVFFGRDLDKAASKLIGDRDLLK